MNTYDSYPVTKWESQNNGNNAWTVWCDDQAGQEFDFTVNGLGTVSPSNANAQQIWEDAAAAGLSQ